MKIPGTSHRYEYTVLSAVTREGLDDFVGVLHSREEILALIEEFVTTNPDGKGDIERELVGILIRCNAFTHYIEKYGNSTICGIEERNNPEEVLKAAGKYKSFSSCFPDKESLKSRFLNEKFGEQLKKIMANSGAPSDYITRLVHNRIRRLSPEIACEGDSTRLLIFKQFLKASEFPSDSCQPRSLKRYVKEITGLSDKPCASEVTSAIRSLTDGKPGSKTEVFDTPHGSPLQEWEGLVWADDIARGYFNDQRTTRAKLYWFAVIFEMTFYSGAPGEREDRETDIQRNLFYNFYADNLLNNLRTTNPSELKMTEAEPTGHGINIKNFAEVIYLYYIHQKNLTPAQKLTKIKKMIRSCKVTDESEIKNQLTLHGSKDTWMYEPVLRRVLGLEEENLRSYIVANYVCGKTGTNPIRAFEENAVAARIYTEMAEELKRSCRLVFDDAQISYEKLYRMMETRYNLGKKCSVCAEALKNEFYRGCAQFEEKCSGAYEEYIAECNQNGWTPKSKPEYYLKKCAKCETASDERLYMQCPLFHEKCRGNYAAYRSGLTRIDEKKEKDAVREELIKNSVFAFFREVCDLTDEISIFDNDGELGILLGKIAHKFRFVERQAGIDEFIDSKFLLRSFDGTSGKKADAAKVVTRTKMIILYYYIFMAHCVAEGCSFDSFKDFYDHFCNNFEIEFKKSNETFYGLNVLLEMSGYQEINPKNIFDITVIFMATRKLNMIMQGY